MSDEQKHRALIGRVDALEVRIDKLTREVGTLSDALHRALTARQEQARQPDWLTVNRASEAEALLLDTLDWFDRIGGYLGLTVPPCWPWHPAVMSLLLDASRHYKAVHEGSATDKVMDFRTRHLPAIQRQLRVDRCRDSVHVQGGQNYTAHRDQLLEMAAWWANNRTGTAPGLTPRIAAA